MVLEPRSPGPINRPDTWETNEADLFDPGADMVLYAKPQAPDSEIRL